MPSNPEEVLKAAAGRPTRSLDIEQAIHHGLRQRRMKQTVLLFSAAIFAVGAWVTVGQISEADDSTLQPPAVGGLAATSPPESSTPEELSTCRLPEGVDFGDARIGMWLRDLLQQVGSPGVANLTTEEIQDTGSALEIKSSAYVKSTNVYVSAERPPDLQHDSTLSMQPLGQIDGFLLYRGTIGDGETYLARSKDWQLSVVIIRGEGSNDRPLRPEIEDWYSRALTKASSNPPPPCDAG